MPTSEDYADSVMTRVTFEAGGGHGWRISALATPRATAPKWKIVVITGSPSWAEYWAPVLAILPEDREMIVVDRPGFANSEPQEVVGDIGLQAEALVPLLESRPGQKVLLVGQSYGAAIATLMAARHRKRIGGLVLISGFFGEPGPTAKWLLDAGARASGFIPRDLRNAVHEVRNQAPQLPRVREALARLPLPVHMIHGDADDFAPFDVAERLAQQTKRRRPIRFERAEGADHFLTDGPAEELLAAIERCLPEPRIRWRWPVLPKLAFPTLVLPVAAPMADAQVP